ncbi:FAD-dependent monooxygenase [Streptomyces avidinii]|uniref:2-polyprenyl-6-methoxyphenol hydroxylase-like FAD-dependent oxidoreductase n=1 Tax=Streptomyces avidinii TaxID=1895 RepID=A0ABS4L6S7_STRAV|nr:FAD-dependent monooxygenase [Streptomyces avidinii]MBP2037814.1 2-polyprenyl-6-methoxyphenol hydroxylase-like FAD-dependent oxidoreductase [Streptomyces avidinii]
MRVASVMRVDEETVMRGGRVAVVGGSIAGCAIATAVARAGAGEVVVLERTRGRLQDRGVGLCIHNERGAELGASGALPAGIAAHPLERRRWVVRDDAHGPGGRVVWEQPFPFRSYHWGLLWHGLRESVPDSVVYRQGETVTGAEGAGGSGADVRLAGGSVERYDLVVGADGYRSVVRAALCPDSRPEYAGYVCWRGNFDAALLTGLGPVADAFPEAVTTVCFAGGSCVIYRIPGPDGPRVNWVLYAAPPQDGSLRLDDPTSFPPGGLTPALALQLAALVDREFPPYWGRALALTGPADTFVQPIYDMETPRAAAGRLLLAGDAASVVRPHNTSGAAKALQDATALADGWRGCGTFEELLRGYQETRGAAGRDLVALARRLGRAQVERTPAWASMNGAEMAAWWRGQLGGSPGIGGRAMNP